MIEFQRLITDWYRLNARDLPWRDTKNPYYIWLSEIILQQTRVDQGKAYYFKFFNKYPTVFDLANASEQEVLNLWQGLGYYSRARNLHAAAKMIVNDFKGVFPNTHIDLLKLKGVGEYSAAAIASFAYDLPFAVLDGNVFRVLSRVFDIDLPIDSNEGKKFFKKLSQELLAEDNAAQYNQAIMEFGAMQCVPVNPKCDSCVLIDKCLSFANKSVGNRPVKSKKVKVTDRFFHFLVFENVDYFYIEKRESKDIWQNMFQFPLIEAPNKEMDISLILMERFKVSPNKIYQFKKHILSHQHIYPFFYMLNIEDESFLSDFIKVAKRDFQDYPIPRVIDRFLEECYTSKD